MSNNTSKQQVTFIAQRSVKEPTIVHFNTKEGERLFVAEKNVKRPTVVSFRTKKVSR